MSLIGAPLTNIVVLSKYKIEISEEDFNKNLRRLTNQIWKLIPMKEKDEDWQKQLDSVILEIVGLNEIFDGSQFLQLLSKLEGLRISDMVFEQFRKTVFEAISLLRERSL